jgi:c-di-GMP-binding flagellar brake protein YcgR
LPAFIVITLLSVLVILFITKGKSEGSVNRFQFYSRGREAGFTIKELELLRRFALKCNIQDPSSLFWSRRSLEACIRALVLGIRQYGESEEQGTHDFLSKLFDFLGKMDMKTADVQSSISSSRQMEEGQLLRILVQGVGVFKSAVVKSDGQYLTLSRPVANKGVSAPQWDGIRISVYFWRDDDAGYVFDTDVIDEVYSKGISSLKVDHCDSLFRTQKRKTLRVKTNKPAYLYLASESDMPGRIEKSPGLKCFLENFSETGCAVRVGGQASAGMRLKIQYVADNTVVCMIGTVRSVDFRPIENQSLLHVQTDPLPLEMRNHVLGEIFGMMPEEDEDELPIRVMEKEVASAPDEDDDTFGDNASNTSDSSGSVEEFEELEI